MGFAAIACFLLFASFRFQTILWLLLKKKNARFFAHYKLFTFIWMIPILSLFVNCKHYKLIFSNEFCLFFAPILCPILIIFESAKHFIQTFVLLKLKMIKMDKTKQNIIINQIFADNECINAINNMFGRQITHSKSIQNIQSIMKQFGVQFPMLILQTFVLIYFDHFLNKFRLIQYFISSTSSFLLLLQTILRMLQK